MTTTTTTGDSPAQAMIRRKSNRSIAAIMDSFDEHVKPNLEPAAAARFRSTLLREINDLVDGAVYICQAERDVATVNEMALDVVIDNRRSARAHDDEDEDRWNKIDNGDP